MKNLLHLLNDRFYLDAKLQEVPADTIKGIPLGIKSQYQMCLLKINQIDCLVLESNQPSITALRKHLDLYDKTLQIPSLLYMSNIAPSMQRFLLENKIAFATKNSLYFPQLLLFLHDLTTKESRLKKTKKLSKLAQMILTYSVIAHMCQIEIDACALKFKVTKMSAGRALHELYEFGFVDLHVIARKKIYSRSFKIAYEELIRSLKNPCSETVYIHSRDMNLVEPKVKASYMALSHYANLVSTQTGYAIDKERFHDILKNHDIACFDQPYDHDLIALELWHFNPVLLQKDYADPLSLYLTLKESHDIQDSRIHDALLELAQQIQGYINDTRAC